MSGHKDITLYTSALAPNGWKVAVVLEELGLHYDSIYIDLLNGEQLTTTFTQLNPNQKVPVIIDHTNDNLVLFESNAILLYLVEQYDTHHRISVVGKDKHLLDQWLFFQAAGQGPYYLQFFWVSRCRADAQPSTTERYRDETLRVLGVLESVLNKQEWLVGGKTTIADISFVTWNVVAFSALETSDIHLKKQFPAVYR
ncbi:thioredoxin-like protein [Calocera cornea HHB12733]|uniref:Thioredoxin-like protein n=1 Tax=Calocera cornea HHB12733 TaxID=1353952 RepID=A0A165H1K8_9BASI|nr:thioredoxin-like protein [Calocera cornea HHB12733]